MWLNARIILYGRVKRRAEHRVELQSETRRERESERERTRVAYLQTVSEFGSRAVT